MRCSNAFTPFVIAALVALDPLPAGAQNNAAPPPPGIADKVQLCATCHGADGLPVVEKVPIIAGQHKSNLLTDLQDFRNGGRPSDLMGPIAKNLSRADIQALAAYFSAMPWPAYRDPSDAASITRVQALDVVEKCTSSCHREGFVGYASTPRVANQKLDYLIKTLSDFHDNKRPNMRSMTVLVRNLSDEDIAAMAHYLAGL
ncbi:c-type cytochrome [Mesorhizobium abyssinicae]|uniref:c-type cytochrome n=1 Tax=Mesorhizobium abyssinicae TaxID=1209958 RepID=UPI002A24745D|nr:c-type cytochrome [Mesorhizobium abyssinicae]MDX8437572.1 c-type cytochrome [Mesorhizobium abyssinicae]